MTFGAATGVDDFAGPPLDPPEHPAALTSANATAATTQTRAVWLANDCAATGYNPSFEMTDDGKYVLGAGGSGSWTLPCQAPPEYFAQNSSAS